MHNNKIYILQLNTLTCFSSSLGGKVSCKALEHLSYLLVDKEANEVGGDVELQRKGGGETASPLSHDSLQSLTQCLGLSVRTLNIQTQKHMYIAHKVLLKQKFQTKVFCSLITIISLLYQAIST